MIVVINHPLVLLPDGPPLHVILQRTRRSDPHHIILCFCPLNVAVLGVRCRNASHILIIIDAVPALPDLPLIQEQLVRVRDHWLWAE